MTKIEKVIRDINNLQDFYKRTSLLRSQIKAKTSMQLKNAEQKDPPNQDSDSAPPRQLTTSLDNNAVNIFLVNQKRAKINPLVSIH